MYCYIEDEDENEDELSFVVGYFKPNGDWEHIVRYYFEEDALRIVHYLNGGNVEEEVITDFLRRREEDRE